MEGIVLEAMDIAKGYGEVQAVRGISFRVRRGEVFGLLGPNGAGKTTTISMLTGLLEPDGGEIRVLGSHFTPGSRDLKARIGLVPQELALYPTLSGRDNLKFFGRIYELKGSRLRRRVEEALEMVGLAERGGDAVETYSGGMERRLNIAAGLIHEPELLFLDEPTVGVDPQSRNAIPESVEALKERGMSVVYTTHYMEEAQRLWDRVAIVDEGEIIALDTPAALIRREGTGMVRVRIGDGAEAPFSEKLASLPEVRRAYRRDGWFVVEAADARRAFVSIVEAAVRMDIPVGAVEILEPNLETVFLKMTGKALRD